MEGAPDMESSRMRSARRPQQSTGRRPRTGHQHFAHHDAHHSSNPSTFFVGGHYRPDPLPSLRAETERFHEMLVDLAQHLEAGTPLLQGMSPERLLQGPFSDAMTHAGQLAILRRLAGGPVAPENFIVADIDAGRCGPEQAEPVSPDETWPEAPAGWTPPSRR